MDKLSTGIAAAPGRTLPVADRLLVADGVDQDVRDQDVLDHDVLEQDVLVEEVSIDGMCGVY